MSVITGSDYEEMAAEPVEAMVHGMATDQFAPESNTYTDIIEE
jgi:hypothetical protein